jgi:CMP-N-acetylneuraminic acid synthetase
VIIFVPIKKNSQRVPHKNFTDFGSDSVSLWIFVLKKYKNHKVYVDTDSDDIIEICSSDPNLSHVTAYKRKPALCGDEVSVCDLIKHFIDLFSIDEPIVQTHVTTPFITEDILESAYKHIKDYDSIISCTTHHTRFWRKEEYGYSPVNHNPLRLEQTQDLPVFYEENSAFYIFNPSIVRLTGNRVGKDPFFYTLGFPHNIDIDNKEDLVLARLIQAGIEGTIE